MLYPAWANLATSRRSADPFGADGGGRRREQDKGALRMKLWVSVLRRAGVAVILLGVVIVGAAVGSIAAAETAAAQQIVVQGNRRVEASTIQSYFRLAPGE